MRSTYENRTIKLLTSATAAAIGLTILGGCSSSKPSFDPKHPTYDQQLEYVPTFMSNMYKSGKVTKCLGTLGLRMDGHVRTYPYADDTGLGVPQNVVAEYSNNSGQFAIHDPEAMTVYDGGNDVSNTWYVATLANGNNVFINLNATKSVGNFACNQPATPETPAGTITAQ